MRSSRNPRSGLPSPATVSRAPAGTGPWPGGGEGRVGVRGALFVLLLAATAGGGLAGCRGGGGSEGLKAELGAPAECGIGVTAVFDAGGSSAGGGAIVEFAFFFGDGSPALRTHRGRVEHVYASPGTYQVAVRVTDDEGETSRDTARVTLHRQWDGPEPCEPPEVTGDEAAEGSEAAEAAEGDEVAEGEGEAPPECSAGESRPCGVDEGACQVGLEACGPDGRFGECVGAVAPRDEECGNLADDDCDGVVDEGCEPCDDGVERACGRAEGECAQGIQICADGAFGPCTGGRGPRDETCDGLDNNCDGSSDEGLTCDCDHGEVRRCGSAQGECRAGQQLCDNGAWGGCEGAIGPSPESCDGLDNDCNGIVDEGCQCDPGDSRQCGNDVGACRSGVQVCEDGGWGTCLGSLPPSDEACDGVDNDCDGQVDEGCACEEGATRTCGSDVGECVSGSQVCRGGGWGQCVGATPPGPEDCDGADNDCNGVVDDLCPCQLGDSRPCGPDQGECRPGRQDCVNGNWGQCTGVTLPQDETCDSRDNDCDGEVDEAMVRRCSTRCGGGVEACVDGQFGRCTAPPVEPEVCDGRDNDCDGAFDEGITRDCSNACGRGEERCAGARFQGCDAPTPAPEECNGQDDDCDGAIDDGLVLPSCPLQLGVCRGSTHPCLGDGVGLCTPATYGADYQADEALCDGLDNDCDGGVDEGCACNPGAQRACGSGIGACQAGIQSCGGGGIWGDCQGSVDPEPEECDGIDNDCDGAADENLRIACSTACGDGFEICADGAFQVCDAPQPEAEQCDGVDNDCDGQIDEDCFCVPGQARACGSDIGQCRAGFQVCLGNQWSPCQGESGPNDEVCDGLDNDCDNAVDEICRCDPGQRQACGLDVGECRSGEQICDNVGAWGACEGAVEPAAEECDGLDNDCDGLLDELCPCQPGSRRICGSDVGACQQGAQICILGRWGPCFGEQGPSPEQCDGVDNDCDAAIDEICECRAGETRQCGVDTGECRRGAQSCLDSGSFGPCQGGVDPVPEVCDGLDNDCNGQADEGCLCRDGDTRSCGSDVGACLPGLQVCVGGVFGPCQGDSGPVAEECDGLDNDCDGPIDEDIPCDCINGAVRRCGSDVGLCSRGTERCADGRWGVCQGGASPAPEECDGLDNDCDGVEDNGLACECINDETRGCGSDVGECIAGTETCLAGAWGACQGSIGPEVEACDGHDNDCDGQTDEGCDCAPGDRRGCGEDVGACEHGEQTCADDGQWGQCQGAVGPVDEECGDGIDNDCDGSVDEGCQCRPGEVQACGPDPVGACRQGQQVCQRNGQWANCQGDIGPSAELCGDAIDNDCNGQTDETCECQDGDARLCGTDIGTCQAGLQPCVGGFWTNQCQGEVGPAPEACDGLDNDCDGAIDPDCECIDGSSQTCGSDIGECQAGIQRCTGGRFEDCEGEVGPAGELCDGLDNDCDGAVDEPPDDGGVCECQIGQVRPCGTDVGSCSVGAQSCGDDGRWGGCVGEVGPSPEACDPAGSDEDCDGAVDEDCSECNPGDTRGCGSDIGACERGVQTCAADGFFGACVGGVNPAPEACNAQDDNCDGVVDEDCDCIHGQPSPCGSDVGRCVSGQADCQFGVLGPCEGGRGPTAEFCNGLDDDCDGFVDDAEDGAACECIAGSSRACGTDVGQCASAV